MTLSISILLSSLIISLAILFVSTKDRWPWKAILYRTATTVALLIALAAGALWLFSQPKESAATPQSLWDLQLGILKQEVLFLKGLPASQDSTCWTYRAIEFGAGRIQFLYFSGDTLTSMLLVGPAYSLPTLQGIETYLSYAEAMSRLGPASYTSTSPDGTSKIFGYDKTGALFEFRKGELHGVGIYLPGSGGISYTP